MNLSEHFTLKELTFTSHRQFDNTPNDAQLANLVRLADFLELVRATIGNRAILVDSGFRSKEVNQAVGSKSTSQHLLGCAADFRVSNMTPAQIVKIIHDAKLPYDQLILELGWTHISIPNTAVTKPRQMALVIDQRGTTMYS